MNVLEIIGAITLGLIVVVAFGWALGYIQFQGGVHIEERKDG